MRDEIEKRGLFLLHESGGTSWRVYREILELVSRFGFISIEEAMYGFDLSTQKAKDRLKYLVKVGLLEKFESGTTPKSFFCLSPLGRRMVEAHQLSDEIELFRPWLYNPLNQRHDRMLVRIYLALQKIFGERLKGWMSEKTLRRNESQLPSQSDLSGRRIMDALFLLEIEKEKIAGLTEPSVPISIARELWWCGLELELTLKSAERYRKQFKELCATVYDPFGKTQKVPLVLFLCGSAAIARALRKYWAELRDQYGRCLFVFGLADEFLGQLGLALLVRCLGSSERDIPARELNRVRVKVSPDGELVGRGDSSCR